MPVYALIFKTINEVVCRCIKEEMLVDVSPRQLHFFGQCRLQTADHSATVCLSYAQRVLSYVIQLQTAQQRHAGKPRIWSTLWNPPEPLCLQETLH